MDLPETMDATTTMMMTAPDFNDFATSIDNNNYDQHYLNEYLYYTFKESLVTDDQQQQSPFDSMDCQQLVNHNSYHPIFDYGEQQQEQHQTFEPTMYGDHVSQNDRHSMMDPCLADGFNQSDFSKWADCIDDLEFPDQTFNTEFFVNFINDNVKVDNSITDSKLFSATTTAINNFDDYRMMTMADNNGGQQQCSTPKSEVDSDDNDDKHGGISKSREVKLLIPVQNEKEMIIVKTEIPDDADQVPIQSVTRESNDQNKNQKSIVKQLLIDLKKLLFPHKLWSLINCPTFSAINWSKNGREIQINIKKLTPFLSQITRSKKFQSFLRQLHMYGFRKTTNFNLKKRKFDRNIVCYVRKGFTRDIEDANMIDQIFHKK